MNWKEFIKETPVGVQTHTLWKTRLLMRDVCNKALVEVR